MESIGLYGFANCTSINFITFPGNLKTINESAFRGCQNLNNITWNSWQGSAITTVGWSAFSEVVDVGKVKVTNPVNQQYGSDQLLIFLKQNGNLPYRWEVA